MAEPGNTGVGVDNTFRRKFNREEYLERARKREEQEEEGRSSSKSKVPAVQRQPLKHRDYEVDLESRLGKTQVVTPIAPLSQQAGYYCSVCECVVKDSANYLDHINGKKHQRALGMSMRVERASLQQFVKLFVGGLGKIRFLLGTEKEPALKYAKWFLDDLMVRTWLINSMQPTISAWVLRLWGCIMRDFDRVGKNYLIMIALSSGQLASAPSEKVLIPPTTTESYAKIVEKTRVFQFLVELNPDFEYAQVHLLDGTPFLTLEEAHAYCLSDQSRRSPMSPISGIPLKTFYYGYPLPLSVPCESPIPPLVSPSVSHPLQVYTRRHLGRQPTTPDCQSSSVTPGLPPATDSPLSGNEPSTTASILVITDDDSPVQDRFENLKKRKVEVVGFTEQDLDERILKQQQEEEERKRQRRERKKEKKKEKAVEEEVEGDPDVAALMGFGGFGTSKK
ncbi:hypothetical protein GIB67_021859 [Kingdonia uniflora]|uniref:U1-type domain-containing protein n=1 Tax=Kingdonia uniflora TaxID=39325 RepID=A0A7J7NEC0_9MAGN|nr:hypothetical protein GIB67_021859 [Kingdonia uniflora]